MTNNNLILIALLAAATSLSPLAPALASGDHEEGEHHHEEQPEDSTQMSDAVAANAGIENLQAGAATIHETVSLTGRVILNPNTTANVKARFAGIVRSVSKGIGDMVSAGDELATVESNDSLRSYAVKAPVSGIVLQRNTNIGDVAGEQPMFVIADLRSVWVEFFIFPRDMARVSAGQKVHVQSTDGTLRTEAKLASLLPVAEASSQTVVGYAVLDNSQHMWRAGQTVQGKVVVAEHQVPVAVSTSAIQRQEGANVIFVREGTSYETRKVELGTGDNEWTQIRSGISAGESYAAKNSFVVKADIGKAGAEHSH